MLCEGDFPETINFDKEQIRVHLQLLGANFYVVTVYGAMDRVYLSRERVLSVTKPGTAVALLQFIIVILATNATSERLFTALRHLKSYLGCRNVRTIWCCCTFTRNEQILWICKRCCVNIIHWRVGASVWRLCSVNIYLSRMRVTPSVV